MSHSDVEERKYAHRFQLAKQSGQAQAGSEISTDGMRTWTFLMSEGVSEVTSTDWGFGRSRADLI